MSEESRKALKMMYHYGYKTIVVSPNPYSALKPKSKEEDLAIKILNLRRKAYLRKLSSYALIIEWDITKPIKTAIAGDCQAMKFRIRFSPIPLVIMAFILLEYRNLLPVLGLAP